MRRTPASLFRHGALLLAASFLPVSPLTGEPVSVPGGPASIRRVLDLGSSRPPREFFLDVNQALLAGSSPNDAWDESPRRRAVALFAKDLASWRAGPGCPAILSARGESWTKTRSALKWLGFRVRGDGPGFEAEPRSDPESQRRQVFLDSLGVPAADALRKLSAGEEVTVPCEDGEAELPFGLAAWRETLGVDEKELNAGNAFLYFVRNVRASRMMVALNGVDARTREAIRTLAGPAGDYGGWALIYAEALDGFARFPEALVIRDGRIRLPGGPEADAAWADVVGAPPGDRARFTLRFFTADSGKPAYVADALRQLPPDAARSFVLGRTGGGEAAVKRFRRLYKAIERAGVSFGKAHRDPYDFAHLVRFLEISADGDVIVPGGAALWLEALAGSGFPEDEAELSRVLADAQRGTGDAEEFLGRLFRREVAGAVLDVPAQKRFLIVSSLVRSRPVLADPGTIVLLFRGLERLGASYAPLEELPLDDPAAVRRYLFTLNRLDTSGAGRPAELRAGLFQATVELLAAMCRSGALPGAKSRELLRSLLDLPLFATAKVEPQAGIGAFDTWLRSGLLVALREEEAPFVARARREAEARDPEGEMPRPAPTPDDLVAASLAGWRPPVTFSFRGGRYRYDASADGAARRRAFAATQQHVSLAGLDDSIAARERALQAARAGDAPAMREFVSALLDQLAVGRPGGRDEDERVLWVAADARLAFGELLAASNADALARLEERLVRFDALRAERTLEALAVHVYASSAGDPAGLPYTDGLFVRRHALSWGRPTGESVTSPFGPTRLARPGEGRGTRIGGSFSGLADVLGLLHAEELVYDARAYVANEQVRAGLIAPVAHITPARLDDEAVRFVASACRATEELAGALEERTEAERLEAWRALAGDLVPALRLNPLASAGSPAAGDYLSPSDLLRIGRRLALGSEPVGPAAREARRAWDSLVARLGEAGAGDRVAEFGPRPLTWAGRSRLADIDMPAYERLSEYRRPQLFAERLYDLKISAARAAAVAGDPAALLPLFLETALDDLLRRARMGSALDWRSLVVTGEALAAAGRDETLGKALESGRITREEDAGTW